MNANGQRRRQRKSGDQRKWPGRARENSAVPPSTEEPWAANWMKNLVISIISPHVREFLLNPGWHSFECLDNNTTTSSRTTEIWYWMYYVMERNGWGQRRSTNQPHRRNCSPHLGSSTRMTTEWPILMLRITANYYFECVFNHFFSVRFFLILLLFDLVGSVCVFFSC